MFWTDPLTKRNWKGRLDKIMDGHIISDLKTCRDCSSYKFGSQAYALGYHIKMAIYWSGYKAITGHEPKMRLLAIESKPPHESAVYRVTKDVLIQGMEELQQLEQTLRQCEETDIWPAREEEETDLQLPTWATTQTDEDFALEGLETE
jgi:hypothetical protein